MNLPGRPSTMWSLSAVMPMRNARSFFGGVERIHRGFEDPSRLKGSEEEVLPEFRRVRDEIKNWIIDYFGGAP